MNKSLKQGFTIIEVVMVLTIMGFLLAAMMLSVQIPINRSQYTDAVNSFQDFLKQQYAELDNTSFDSNNTTALGPDCNDPTASSGAANRFGGGRSNCSIVGRVIYINNDTGNSRVAARVHKVYYKESDSAGGHDFDNFFATDINKKNQGKTVDAKLRAGEKVESFDYLSWLSALRDPSGNPLNLRILILKSPVDGTVRTYVGINGAEYEPTVNSDKASNALENLIKSSAAQNNHDFCLHPMNNPYGPVQAVRINAKTTGPSGIEIMPTDVNTTRVDGHTSGAVRCR